jgi:hypothetical protein
MQRHLRSDFAGPEKRFLPDDCRIASQFDPICPDIGG